MDIKRTDEADDRVGEFINRGFAEYAHQCDAELRYEAYCFTAEEDGRIIGAITGHAYYNEVHISDLLVDEKYRGRKVGSKLVEAVEKAYVGKEYSKITLTTFGFQAPEFYKKLGYTLEYVREDRDAKLSKYYYIKSI